MSDGALHGKVAVVTGAGRGIGRAIAEGYARAGAAVCCSARSGAELDDTVRSIVAGGARAIAVRADVLSADDVTRVFDATAAAFGGVDVVVVNAGATFENKTVEESDPVLWKQTIDVNLGGAFHTARAAIPHLRRRGSGKLLFVGSGMGHRGAPARSAYAASKAGLWMLVRVLAQELAEHGICVNELVPGPVLTAFIRGREDVLRNAAGPAGEWMKTPEDVVPLALFLATQPDRGPTGQSFGLARREL